MANKSKIKKKERMVKKMGKKEKITTLSEKKEEASNPGQRLDTRNPCTRYNPLSSDNTAGQQTLTNTPHKEGMRGLVKHRDYPPHSYIVTERYNSKNKRASPENLFFSEWQEPI